MRQLYTVGYEGYEGYVAGYGRVRWGTAMGLLQFDAVAAARCASRLASRTAIMNSRLFSNQNIACVASPRSSARFQACQQLFL